MLDRHSEIIAHFIGQFDQVAEQSLYRLHYDAFRAQQRPEEEPGALLEVNIHVKSELMPDKHIAGRVKWDAQKPTPQDDQVPLEVFARDVGPVLPVLFEPFAEVAVEFEFNDGLPYYAASFPAPVFDFDAPGSLIVFAYQQNSMQDNDLLITRPLDLSPELAASRSDAALNDGLMTLAATADALVPGDFTLGREIEDTAARIETLRETYAGINPAQARDGATVTLVSQADGTLPESGILINGAEADSLPDTLEQALEDRDDDGDVGDVGDMRPEDGGDEIDDGNTGGNTGGDGVVSGTIVIGPDDAGPQSDATQLIEAGGNLLMNTAMSGLALVDAPLIAVAGQAISLTVISQVNVMSDRDTLVGPDEAICTGTDHAFEDPASEGHNIASVTWEGATRGEAESTGGPIAFAITEIEGDLVLTTHVIQLNLVTDNDMITFETTFYQVEIGTGGNVSLDVLNQLGFQTGFDMILVGGDMQTLVSMSQLNLLFDNDLVADGDGVGGDINTSGNLLWNEAQVTWHGIDTAAEEVSDSAAEALDTMAGGQLDFEALKGESLLDGKEVPLLLTIGGNLVFDYRLEQINILADADTVQLFADMAEDNGFNPVDVATGDNLLANVASLDIHGTDSTIMATDGVFSDLVIHQAGMYDTDDTPLDLAGAGSDLASEAVVFLADGMIDDGQGIEPGGGDVIVDTGGGSGTFDTLGGVVA
ncbi:MAG TPA: hypothetical protein DIU07_07220 [Rhodobacteraceae bacterium]|nr:hypothetical protein [Paracoccaceae bacterium]